MSLVTGAPDFQHAVTASQRIVAQEPSSVSSVTVNVPPNTQSLWIIGVAPGSAGTVEVIGNTSLVNYPVSMLIGQIGAGNTAIFGCSLVAAVDTSFTVIASTVSGKEWYVVADFATRIVEDLTLAAAVSAGGLAVSQGIQTGYSDSSNGFHLQYGGASTGPWGVSVPPGLTSKDHPPAELAIVFFNGSFTPSGATVISAPGSGKRIRIFYAKISVYANVANGAAMNATSGGVTGQLITCGTGTLGPTDIFTAPLSGVPLDANTGITLSNNTGSTSATAVVLCTEETI